MKKYIIVNHCTNGTSFCDVYAGLEMGPNTLEAAANRFHDLIVDEYDGNEVTDYHDDPVTPESVIDDVMNRGLRCIKIENDACEVFTIIEIEV